MISEPRRTGLLGEIRAAQYIRKNGFDVWAANYRTKSGEIDLIAVKNGVLCFIEVKTRKEGGYFSPSDAVDYKKEENVKSTAAAYMSGAKLKMRFRFDIIEVVVSCDGVSCTVRYIENAF